METLVAAHSGAATAFPGTFDPDDDIVADASDLAGNTADIARHGEAHHFARLEGEEVGMSLGIDSPLAWVICSALSI